jgi:xanthine dehydrogenase accessory factor
MVRTAIDLTILIRGGGEMASGIAHRLHQSRMKVLITEVATPTAVRRTLAFAEAVYLGSQTVENVKAVLVKDAGEAEIAWQTGHIPLLVDPDARIREIVAPDVLIDAIMAKKNTTTRISDAPLVIGIGPGFVAGSNAHAIVESNRGYNLGRVIWDGSAEPDTGVPAPVSGYAEARVFRAPRSGCFTGLREIGDHVQSGECVAEVDGAPITAQISGMIRGMLRSGIPISAGAKVGDIDPRGQREYCYSISDKSRAIAGGVLEAILHSFKN